MVQEYKIVILGSGGVGKSALTIQYVTGIFLEMYDPTIEDAYRKHIQLDGKHYMIEIIDTAGQQEFEAMRDQYMRDGQGFVLVYSVTTASSFRDIDNIHDRILKVKDSNFVPVMLVGNKIDMDDNREVSKESGREKAKKFNCGFLETSAKTKINLNEIFSELIKKIEHSIPNEKLNKKKKKWCCLL